MKTVFKLNQNMERHGHNMEENCLISCEDAGFGYENKAVLEHFDFQIRAGEYICVIGENGSGKSTLIKSLLGLIRPISGRIERNPVLSKGAIGYLPQQTQVQRHFPVSVMEVVLSGFLNDMHFRPFYTPAEKKAAKRNLKRLGILDLQKTCYGELSGGQQQRVLLARALCAADKILILDEPVTGLDPAAAQVLYESLAMLNEEGMAIMMVTHDLQNAIRYSDKVLHISQEGHFFGTVEEYMQSDYAAIFKKEEPK